MIDLTEYFLKAFNIKNDVPQEVFLQDIKQYAEKRDLRTAWDQGDGEEWGVLINKDELVLYFSAKLPLLFVSSKYIEEAKANVNHSSIIIIEVQDFDAPIYCLNTSISDSILKWHSSISSNGVSIKDLWFATI